MARMGGIAAKAEALLGVAVVATTPVAGGDTNTATRLRLTDGRSAVLKTRPQVPHDFYTAEAEGLQWLGEAGAPVPQVLGVSADCLVVSWIEPGKATADAAESLGRALAATHRAGADEFGYPRDGYIGLAPLPNKPAPTWTEFYTTRRILPYLKVAVDRGAMTTEDAAPVEEVVRRIDDFAGPPEPPARIHGDLWSGNVVWSTEDRAFLIDPAAHGCHRETDLAMLALFGIQHLQRILDAYIETFPLADGWHERVPLHQLHPLLVHAALFGGGYGARARAAAEQLLDGEAPRATG
ncbi:fructosamine kinase family protein [Mumia sp. zg.B53]|uniref:fructosamine kinase family protein n=1 Tax=unclassified Mumia TaxID=2621872 RepID=UPI001C6E4FF6|nr:MULTISPECIES: fructosamine kinase family protein [unclassified Mumia]MBW9204322.1 fructosamine kinase family protein [Mumia sp. zg.B17]MBW9209693.1 fructosamine kinase family protein [Mumia sp. zg.B21]MBW9214297.1 fructosamine kinase family protein [Mumia sp. zg.B53]MDD9348016.1 fructosamine kinase family protein [Mumia sp.]